jgi:hypothetical protein
VVVVYASEEIQIKRLAERGIQPEEAKKRIKAQQPLEEKVKFADFVIYNNGSLKETREQVERIYSIIKKEVTASCLKKSYLPKQFEEVVKDGEAMYRKILLEVELGQRGVEKCNIAVYLEGKLIGSYFDKSYNNLPEMANELRAKYQDAVIEAWCLGDDCTGRTHRWKVDI